MEREDRPASNHDHVKSDHPAWCSAGF
jgi:hypothetical protein